MKQHDPHEEDARTVAHAAPVVVGLITRSVMATVAVTLRVTSLGESLASAERGLEAGKGSTSPPGLSW